MLNLAADRGLTVFDPALCIEFSFWESDEDFPAQLQLFTDKNLLQYIHYETAWYMFGYLLTRIAESFDQDGSLF